VIRGWGTPALPVKAQVSDVFRGKWMISWQRNAKPQIAKSRIRPTRAKIEQRISGLSF
jgi:hypothetical protein